jgi:DNA-binding transcriptional LysR family regulator
MSSALQPITKINLKLLQTFMLVAEHNSFRHAADETRRSQSAVSTQIKQLESQLGVPLFHRTTRRVQLTTEGEQLLVSSRRAIQEVELCLRKLNETVDIKRGRIALSCSPTIAATRLPRILSIFEQDYPGIQMFIREQSSDDLFNSVRNQEVDFGIGPTIQSSDFEFETILNDDLYALVPRHLMPKAKESITLEQLARLPILLLNPATALRSLLEDTMRARKLRFTTKYEFTQAQTLISMASVGLGAAILPKTVTPDARDTPCHVLRVVDPPLFRQVAIITVRGQALSPAAARLAQLLRQFISPPNLTLVAPPPARGAVKRRR